MGIGMANSYFRIIRVTDGMPVGIVEAKTARGAIRKAHNAFGYNQFNRAYPASIEEVEEYRSGMAFAQWAENMQMARINLRLARAAGLLAE